MKAISAILLLTFYLLVSVGISVNVHYCGGEIEQVSLLSLNGEDGCSSHDHEGAKCGQAKKEISTESHCEKEAEESAEMSCCSKKPEKKKEGKKGCCDDKQEDGGCCENQSYFFQLSNDNQLISNERVELNLTKTACAVLFTHFYNIEIEPEPVSIAFTDLPPPKDEPRWLLNCSLTYYG